MGAGLLDVSAEARPLDLHEGIDDPAGRKRHGCERWPETLRLKSDSGEFVRGRCKATNKCRYCRKLATVETVEMLILDAMEYAPTLWAVLTAREHLTRAECRRHLAQLLRAARRRWPGIEWHVQVEFQRRGALHLNLTIKGVPVADREALEAVLVPLWCSRVDALPAGQWVAEISDAGGLMRYLSKMLAHGLKAEQAPPLGWPGHRTSQTKGYLVRPASEMRLEAKRALALKRLLWRGVPGDLLEAELELARSKSWELVEVRRLGGLAVIEPMGAPQFATARMSGRGDAGVDPGTGPRAGMTPAVTPLGAGVGVP